MDERTFAERGITKIRALLTEYGYEGRAADKTDFQKPDDRSLFFQTGTAYREVTVIPVHNERRLSALRASTDSQLDALLENLRLWLDLREEGSWPF